MNIPDPSIGYDGWSRVMGEIGRKPAVKVPVRRPVRSKAPVQLVLPVVVETAPERAAS